MLFNRKMARVTVGLGLMALCSQAMGQLDIIGHKEMLKKQEQESQKLEVKTEKSFQVFEAVKEKDIIRENNSSSSASKSPKSLLTVKKINENETSTLADDGEMVSYSTKVSVSMKTDNNGEQIDRTSYYVPPGGNNFIRIPQQSHHASYPGSSSPQHYQYPTINENLTPTTSLQSHPENNLQSYPPSYPPSALQGYTSDQTNPYYHHQAYPQTSHYPLSPHVGSPGVSGQQPAVSGVQYGVTGQQPAVPGVQYGVTGPSYGYSSYPDYGHLPYHHHHHQPPLQPGVPYHQQQLYQPHQQPAELRQGLPYGELYPKEYLTAPVDFDDIATPSGDSEQLQVYDAVPKSEAKVEEGGVVSAEKRGLGLGGIGAGLKPHFKPIGPHLGGIGHPGAFGHPIGHVRPLVKPIHHHHIRPHIIPVPRPVPVHVPVVRTFHTNHIQNHDHVHKHKNTHNHNHKHEEEHKHKHEEEHNHVHRHTHHHDHHHNHKHRSEHEERHKHGHKHQHGHDHGHEHGHHHSDGGYVVSR